MLRATSPVFVCEPLEGRALLSVAAAAVHHPHHHRVVHHAKVAHPARVTDPPIFVQISGIFGESTDQAHRGAIDAASFSLGASNPSTLTTTGRPVAIPVSFLKNVDGTTPLIFDSLVRGRNINRIIISVTDPNNTRRETARYTFSNVLITNDSISATTTSNNAESVSFVYDIETITTLNRAGVPVSQSFSFLQNRAA